MQDYWEEIEKAGWDHSPNRRVDEVSPTLFTPLMFVVENCPHLIPWMVNIQKANPNAVDMAGQTALHKVMASAGYKSLENCLSNINDLIDVGANPNLCAYFTRTPLHMAVNMGEYGIPLVRLLLEKKANIEISDVDGITPLMHALSCHEQLMATLLIECGANVHALDKKHHTVLFYAVSDCPKMIGTLLRQGVDPDHISSAGETIWDIAMSSEDSSKLELLQFEYSKLFQENLQNKLAPSQNGSLFTPRL